MKISVSDFFFQLFFRGIALATVIHEYGHLLALRLVGAEGEIRSTMLNAVYPTTPLSGTDALIFYGGGGFFQGFAFLIMTIRNKDAENRLVNFWMAIQGFTYGLFEAFAPRNFWEVGSSVGLYLGLFIVFGYIIWKKIPMTP